jgi:hypothetical protein
MNGELYGWQLWLFKYGFYFGLTGMLAMAVSLLWKR